MRELNWMRSGTGADLSRQHAADMRWQIKGQGCKQQQATIHSRTCHSTSAFSWAVVQPCNASAPKLCCLRKIVLCVSSAGTLNEAQMRTGVEWIQGQPCFYRADPSNANWRAFIPSTAFICFFYLQVSWGENVVIIKFHLRYFFFYYIWFKAEAAVNRNIF